MSSLGRGGGQVVSVLAFYSVQKIHSVEIAQLWNKALQLDAPGVWQSQYNLLRNIVL